MSDGLIVHRFVSRDGRRSGIEFPVPLEARRTAVVAEQIRQALGLGKPDFIVVHLQEGDESTVSAETVSTARLCASRSVATFNAARVRGSLPILLDDVDIDTPPDVLTRQSIVAVRFAADFMRRASTELPATVLLTSMLKMCRDMGLASLCPVMSSVELDTMTRDFDFDYRLDYSWHDRRRRSEKADFERRRVPLREFETSR